MPRPQFADHPTPPPRKRGFAWLLTIVFGAVVVAAVTLLLLR
jgi:hypothetical protein